LVLFWHKYRLGFAGAGMAVLILVAAIGGSALMGDGGNDNTVFPVESRNPSPAVVTALQQQVEVIRSKQASQQLTADDIVRLQQAAADLRNTPASELDPAINEIAVALTDADALVAEIINSQDPNLAAPALVARDEIREVAAGLDVPLASATVAETASPVSTPAPTPTIEATPTEQPEPTDEPTPVATEAPTPDPQATEEPPPRQPAVP
jgi:hypothetical protein